MIEFLIDTKYVMTTQTINDIAKIGIQPLHQVMVFDDDSSPVLYNNSFTAATSKRHVQRNALKSLFGSRIASLNSFHVDFQHNKNSGSCCCGGGGGVDVWTLLSSLDVVAAAAMVGLHVVVVVVVVLLFGRIVL
jgi:hypothetical protein